MNKVWGELTGELTGREAFGSPYAGSLAVRKAVLLRRRWSPAVLRKLVP